MKEHYTAPEMEQDYVLFLLSTPGVFYQANGEMAQYYVVSFTQFCIVCADMCRINLFVVSQKFWSLLFSLSHCLTINYLFTIARCVD